MSEGQLNYRVNENAARSMSTSAGFFVPYIFAGMKLLDCGCGPGSITLDLAEAIAPGEVIGVDHDESSLELARQAAAKRGIQNARFESGDIYNLPFADNSFDGVWTSSVVQWLAEPAKALQEIFRVLTPGGVYASRDRDRRGDLFGNANRLIRRALNLHYWQNELLSGGDLSFGGKMRSLMLKAGFENVVTDASYESHSGPDGARFIVGNYDRILREDIRPTAVRVIKEQGWADDGQLAQMLVAWKTWADDARSFYCICRVENVGWKPAK
jgi:ubiquinone/menaquinone biosynthesis C-methylase UbiE